MEDAKKTSRTTFIAVVGTVVGLVVEILAQVSPHDAQSNLAAWAALVGVDHWPVWLTDRRAQLGVGLFILGNTTVALRAPLHAGFGRLMAWAKRYRLQWPIESIERRDRRDSALRETVENEARPTIRAMEEKIELATMRSSVQGQVVKSLESQLEDARARADTEKYRGRRHFQQDHFGRLLPDERVEDTLAFAAMRQSLEELKSPLDRLLTSSDEMWNGLLAMARGTVEGSSDSALAWLLWCFKNFPSKYGVNGMRAFIEFVDSERDPRPYLVAAYAGYSNWRQWLLLLLAMLGRSAEELPNHSAWIEAENEFTTLLERKLEISLLSEARGQIREYAANSARLRFPSPRPVTLPNAGTIPPSDS